MGTPRGNRLWRRGFRTFFGQLRSRGKRQRLSLERNYLRRRSILKTFALLALLSASAFASGSSEHFDESVNHAPPFQIYQYDKNLDEIFQKKNIGSLCWPSSVAHRMMYYQKYHQPPLSDLAIPSISEGVRTFVDLCHTSLSQGTSQNAKIACIVAFLQKHGYQPLAFSIGKASRGVPASPGAHNQLRPVQISDFRTYIGLNYGVILHVGWLKFDRRKRAWIESGSHSLNAYGYDYNKNWGDDRIVLKVANPGMNYSAKPQPRFFDAVTVSPLIRQAGVRYPEMVTLAIHGPGFDNPNRLAVIDDLFVFSPGAVEIK